MSLKLILVGLIVIYGLSFPDCDTYMETDSPSFVSNFTVPLRVSYDSFLVTFIVTDVVVLSVVHQLGFDAITQDSEFVETEILFRPLL